MIFFDYILSNKRQAIVKVELSVLSGHSAKMVLPHLQSIENAINLHWSNGPVEGNINKLKTINVKCTEGQASIYSGKD
ncbi:hypothetical protein GCM10007422_28600 [Pedobacter zeae]|uniref:Transposase n=1 Tax=Pedobacter zeae TaxID=1737356 RepID=A0A7W6KC54_9SPHI|nr:transposase [Pedobacter zeae]GGH10129.1 hypothetical protein GCM10007422_28600 [Pedobacter zeae]